MKGTIPFIIKNIKPRLVKFGFKKTKYSFEKTYNSNFKVMLFITSVNYIDFQDMEVSIHIMNTNRPKLIEFISVPNYQPHGDRILSFQFTQFVKMSNDYFGKFNCEKYFISTEKEADDFTKDLNVFFDETIFSEKINTFFDFDIIETIHNEPPIFISKVVKDINYNRFFDGLIFSKLSTKNNLTSIFKKYNEYTKNWRQSDKENINQLYERLLKVDRIELLKKLVDESNS